MRSPDIKLIFVLFLIVSLLTPVLGHALVTSDIEPELMCDCGCGDILANCTCERSEEFRGIINGMIQSGKTKKEVIAAFVAQFGEVILSSPPPSGFNLVAYIAPGVGLLMGLGVAVVFVRRWTVSGRDEEDDEDMSGDELALSDEIQHKIDEELDNLEED